MPRTTAPTANRTDQNVPPTMAGPGQPNGQPVQVPTGLPYGEAGQLQQAQEVAPLPAGGGQAPAPGSPGAPQPGGVPAGMAAALQAAKQTQLPATGGLSRPTERPGEAVTAGLPNGPTPMGVPPQQQSTGSIAAMLQKMSGATGSAALSQLAGRAAAVGQ